MYSDNEHCAPVGGNIPLGDLLRPCYPLSGQCLVLPQSAVCTMSCNPQSSSSCPAGLECVGQGIDGVVTPLAKEILGNPALLQRIAHPLSALASGMARAYVLSRVRPMHNAERAYCAR